MAYQLPVDCLPTSPKKQLEMLCWTIDLLKPMLTAHHLPVPQLCDLLPPKRHVFIHHDGYQAPLTAAYDRLFKVIKQTDKVVTIKRGSNTNTISVDQCKLAMLEAGEVIQQPLPWGRPPSCHSQITQGASQAALLPPSTSGSPQPSTSALPPLSTSALPLPAQTNTQPALPPPLF